MNIIIINSHLLVFVHADALKESLATYIAEVSLLRLVHAPHVHREEAARAKHLAALFAHAGRALAMDGLHVELEVGVGRAHDVTQSARMALVAVLAAVVLVVQARLVAAVRQRERRGGNVWDIIGDMLKWYGHGREGETT